MNGCEVGAEAHLKRSYRNRPLPDVLRRHRRFPKADVRQPSGNFASGWFADFRQLVAGGILKL